MTLLKSIVLFSFLMQNSFFAQIHTEEINNDTCKSDLIHNLKYDFNSFVNVGVEYFKSPFHFDTEDFLITGLIVGGTAFSFGLDEPVREGARRTHNKTMNRITDIAENLGDWKYGTALGGLLYVSGHITGDKYIRETGLMLYEAMILNGFITGALKTIMGRSRPYNNEGNAEFHFFNFKFDNDYQSLPSGHTSTAFTIVTVLSERIGNLYASIVLYSVAAMTAYHRIYDDKHWFSDTGLGAAIGTITGLAVVNLYSKVNELQSNKLQLNIFPNIGRGVYGINLSLRL